MWLLIFCCCVLVDLNIRYAYFLQYYCGSTTKIYCRFRNLLPASNVVMFSMDMYFLYFYIFKILKYSFKFKTFWLCCVCCRSWRFGLFNMPQNIGPLAGKIYLRTNMQPKKTGLQLEFFISNFVRFKCFLGVVCWSISCRYF